MIADRLDTPVVLAPLAGGPSTVELAVAVAGAGGLGFLAAGYLPAAELEERIARFRAHAPEQPVAVNLFVPGPGPSGRDAYAPYLERLTAWAGDAGLELGEPRSSDDDWEAKLELLRADPVDVVSFTFGCPDSEVLEGLSGQGIETWVTITTPEEAAQAAQAGAQVLVAQGLEAGGHRGSFVDRPEGPVYGLLALLTLVGAEVPLPLVASGGIATGAGLAAVLAAGARAAQIGTAFLRAPEAGTSAAHRAALAGAEPTVLTRAFTGRLARGIRNAFTDAHTAAAPVAYPELHYVTAPMRRRARETGDADLINLWAGQSYPLTRELPAAEIVRTLADEARATLQAMAR